MKRELTASAAFLRHFRYLETVREELIACETIITSIKSSKDYINCIHYFNRLQMEGKINQQPTFENGYTIEPNSRTTAFNIKHWNYLMAIRETMITNQAKRHQIKSSKAFKDCKGYFQLLKYRGQIKENPNYENSYTVSVI